MRWPLQFREVRQKEPRPRSALEDASEKLEAARRHDRVARDRFVEGERPLDPGVAHGPEVLAAVNDLCRNQIVAARLRHGSIMASTPSTRRRLDGVPLGVSHRSCTRLTG